MNLNVNYHNTGLFIITFAFIYSLISFLIYKDSYEPTYFYLIYAIGGYFIMLDMNCEKKTEIVIMELIGATIALYLFFNRIYLLSKG